MHECSILVIDDDLRMRQLVRDTLAVEGIASEICDDSRTAARILEQGNIDIVISDLMMPHLDGMDILDIALKNNPDCIVILITGYGTIESAVEAIRKGAYDYMQKPFEPDDLVLIAQRAREHQRLLAENKRLRQQVKLFQDGELIGTSRPIAALKEFLGKIAPVDTTVLIQGETGTGKELVAKLIHKWSNRKNNGFLPINCGALPEQLLESELFGHEKGSFTGAVQNKKGLLEAAEKGTLFLDEINSISPSFQVKLLRVLQEGTFFRVGGREPRSMNARIIVAGNTSIEDEVKAGRFRQDLFYRLNVVPVTIPPLRERPEDIPLLAHHFLKKYAVRYGAPVKSLTPETSQMLKQHSWPGNVRELENIIERAVITSNSEELTCANLPSSDLSLLDKPQDKVDVMTFEEMEIHLIRLALSRADGNRQKTAKMLKTSPATLWRKMKKYHLQ